MSVECDREGIFRAEIVDYGLRDTDKSQSVAVSVRVNLTEHFHEGEWLPWPKDNEMQASGDIWIIGKDGKMFDDKVQSLVKYAGWDGTFESIVNHTWVPTPCQVSTEADTDKKGNTRYRVGFLNDYSRTPGQVGTVGADKAKELAARYGAPLRALAGSAKRSAAPANGSKPSVPPPPKAPPVAPASRGPTDADYQREVELAAQSKPGQDGIPFAWLIGLGLAAAATGLSLVV